MKKHKTKIIFSIFIIAILAFSFWYGGDAPGLRGWPTDSQKSVPVSVDAVPSPLPEPTANETPATDAENLAAEKDHDLTEPIPEETTISEETTIPEETITPIEPQDGIEPNGDLTCVLSVRCDSILQHIEWLDPEKVELVPQNGIIYAERTVIFYEGENVFDVLLREMKQNRIHMEFEYTPLYNSVYIEGISNLYEFDCGELSGWMYRVNGWFPNYGCSQYQLKNGDRVEWLYTCDLGADIGGSYAISGE